MKFNKGDRVRYDDASNGRMMGTVSRVDDDKLFNDDARLFVAFDDDDTIGVFRQDDNRLTLVTARPDEGSESVSDEALKAISADMYEIKTALFAISETLSQLYLLRSSLPEDPEGEI